MVIVCRKSGKILAFCWNKGQNLAVLRIATAKKSCYNKVYVLGKTVGSFSLYKEGGHF